MIRKADLEQINISFCRGCRNTTTYPISVSDALVRIKDGTYKDDTLKCRDISLEKEKRDRIKANMDAFLFSGSFSKRKAQEIETYSKLMVFDIDHLDNAEEVKRQLKDDPYIVSVWISVRGQGVKGIISLDYSEIEKIPLDEGVEIDWINCHKKLAFEQVKVYFHETYHLELDPSGSDISRLCFASFDPELIIKEDAECFPVRNETKEHPLQKKKYNNFQKKEVKTVFDEGEVYRIERRHNPFARRKMQSIIKYLRKRNLSITGNYLDWYVVGQAIANSFSYSVGKKYYLSLCRLDGINHDEEKSIKKLIECYKNDDPSNSVIYVTYSKIMAMAKDKNWGIGARSNGAEKD